MIFKVILFFIVTAASNLYPIERHTYSASRLVGSDTQKDQASSKSQRTVFNVESWPNTDSAIKVIDILRSIQQIRLEEPPQKTSTPSKKVLENIQINLSGPLNQLVVFKSGPPALQQIKDARMAITQLAYVLELAELLIGDGQLSGLYTYLKEMKATFGNVPFTFDGMKPQEIVTEYIADCYRPIVEGSVGHWFKKTVQLTLEQDLQEKITNANDQIILQIIEILQKLSTIWNEYARLFTDNKLQTVVSLSYPDKQLSIETWDEITYKKAEELYRKTDLGKKALQEEIAQRMAELAKHKRIEEERRAQVEAQREQEIKAAAEAKEAARVKRQKELAEFNAYKDRVLEEMAAFHTKALAEHAEEGVQLMRSSIKKTKTTHLKDLATDLTVLKATITITDPSIMLINDEIDAALAACEIISEDTIADVEKTVVSSFIRAYEWLQEPRDMAAEKYQSDDDEQPEPYDDSYLHLKYKFNQQKLLPQLHYVLSKAVYVWNVYGYVRYSGKLETNVTLKFSAFNTPEKSITDWINFTKSAGFSYKGQFAKLLKQKPRKSIGNKFFEAYKWLKEKAKRKPTPKLSAERTQELLEEMENDARAIEQEEAAELEKIKKIMSANEDRIKNPEVIPAPQTLPTTVPTETKLTEKATVSRPKYADFDPDFAQELRGMFKRS